MWCPASSKVATDFCRSLLGLKPSYDLCCYPPPALPQLLQYSTFIQEVFYSPCLCGIELCISLCSALHTAAILSYICSSLSMANLDNLPQPSSSCLQLGLGGSISSLFISVLCLTIFLLRRLFLLFIIIILFSQHTLLLLDFSTVWFCKIPRPLNTRWLLWNIKMLALHGTDPLHLHRFAVAQPQPVEVVTLAGWLFLRHSRCTLGQRIF